MRSPKEIHEEFVRRHKTYRETKSTYWEAYLDALEWVLSGDPKPESTVVCDVCGNEIKPEQTAIHIPAIGYMHDKREAPECQGLIKK